MWRDPDQRSREFTSGSRSLGQSRVGRDYSRRRYLDPSTKEKSVEEPFLSFQGPGPPGTLWSNVNYHKGLCGLDDDSRCVLLCRYFIDSVTFLFQQNVYCDHLDVYVYIS